MKLSWEEKLKIATDLAHELGYKMMQKDIYEAIMMEAEETEELGGVAIRYAEQARNFGHGPQTRAMKKERQKAIVRELTEKGKTARQIKDILDKKHSIKITEKTIRNYRSEIRHPRHHAPSNDDELPSVEYLKNKWTVLG